MNYQTCLAVTLTCDFNITTGLTLTVLTRAKIWTELCVCHFFLLQIFTELWAKCFRDQETKSTILHSTFKLIFLNFHSIYVFPCLKLPAAPNFLLSYLSLQAPSLGGPNLHLHAHLIPFSIWQVFILKRQSVFPLLILCSGQNTYSPITYFKYPTHPSKFISNAAFMKYVQTSERNTKYLTSWPNRKKKKSQKTTCHPIQNKFLFNPQASYMLLSTCSCNHF